jgi:PPM family protein phosphatase
MWAATNTGFIRKVNEDRFCIGDWASHGKNESLEGTIECARGWAVIADGMGGHDAGELASELAIETIHGLIAQVSSEHAIAHMLERANERIFEEMFGDRGRPAMGSTAVGVCFRHGDAFAFNIGDSRLYLVREGLLVQQSIDDTLNRPIRARGSRSHALTQSLGGSLSRLPLNPHVKCLTVADREQLLLCSDGLTDMLSDDEVAGVLLRLPPHPAEALVSAALDAGGEDNVTVIVIDRAMRIPSLEPVGQRLPQEGMCRSQSEELLNPDDGGYEDWPWNGPVGGDDRMGRKTRLEIPRRQIPLGNRIPNKATSRSIARLVHSTNAGGQSESWPDQRFRPTRSTSTNFWMTVIEA